MSTTKSMTTKLTVLIAAMAMALFLAVAPGQAFAAAGNQNEPDNIVSVNGTTVDLDAVYAKYHDGETQTALGGLFVQSGAVKVVKTDKYVTISDIVKYANEEEDASITWASGKTVTFDAWNLNSTKTAWEGVAEYTKNKTFTYDNLVTNCKNFYDASSTAINTSSALASSEAVIALKSTTVTIPSGSSASSVLSDDTNYPTVGYTTGTITYDTPRLVWGYNSSVSNQAGNRFPSNIDGITIG